ncbi:MAG: hypothetical protein CVU05_15840, partial [Bacteroidetes bacterium HGW-Bacteroidetes-21]
TAPLKIGYTELSEWVVSQGGIIVPAHIDRPVNGLLMQMGKIPDGLKYDALEISAFSNAGMLIEEHPIIATKTIIRSSDSHVLKTIGNSSTIFSVESLSFDEIKWAMNKKDGRSVIH